MLDDDDIDELKAEYICFRCVGEEYLREEIQHKGRVKKCFYCGKRGRSYTIDDLSEMIESAFEQHFVRTSEDDGQPVVDAIADAAAIPEVAAQAIQSLLEDKHYDHHAAKAGEESEFALDCYYAEKGVSDYVWQEEWRNFEHSLKSEARFFSRTAAAHLASVFGSIDKMSATDGRPLVLDAGPGTSLTAVYRARVFQSDERLKVALCRPDQQLGSPSMADASGGRMNARGISVFYGANEPGVAIAEVRPPVGSQVAVARFSIIRRLRLLDLTALSAVSERGSLFDSTFASRLERATFLRSLSERITRPILPDDEALDYLTTQAIADFLATENEPMLDGILFPSGQAAGNALNIVLFHKAARIEAIDLPEGTEIDASTGLNGEEGWEPWYSVSEVVLPKDDIEHNRDDIDFPSLPEPLFGEPWRDPRSDVRESTLRIDLESIKVNVVQRVKFECEEHNVHRHRSTKHKPKF